MKFKINTFQKISRAIYFIKRNSLNNILLEIMCKMLFLKSPIRSMKIKTHNIVVKKFGYKIAYGVFKEMKLSSNPWWGYFDTTSKILGEYEKTVCLKIHKILKNNKMPFIDIGAADGFYAVGVARSGLSEKTYAFEISPRGRESIKLNARLNGCIKKLIIKKEANYLSLKKIIDKNKSCLVLIDIEGSEYELLSNKILKLLRHCELIIESHPHHVSNGKKMEQELISRSKKFFNSSIIERGPYNPNKFKILADLTDDERLLSLSEGRLKNPKWLYFKPYI